MSGAPRVWLLVGSGAPSPRSSRRWRHRGRHRPPALDELAAANPDRVDALALDIHAPPRWRGRGAAVQRRWSDHRAWLRRLLRDQQPGDQAKAAVASRTALAAQHTALRLPLGDDAMDGIRAHLAAGGDEVLAGEPLSRSTSFDPH
jgi:hypothetical protein